MLLPEYTKSIDDQGNPKFEVKYDESTQAGINNKILKAMDAILASPHSTSQRINPGGFDTLRHFGYIQEILRNLDNGEVQKLLDEKVLTGLSLTPKTNIAQVLLKDPSKTRDVFESMSASIDPMSLEFNIDTINRNIVGKALVAMFANLNTLHTTLQQFGGAKMLPQMAIHLMKGGQVITYDQLGEIHPMNDGKIEEFISKIISEYLAASVDNGKDPVLGYYGLSMKNINDVSYMLLLGMSQFDISNIINSPLFNKFRSMTGTANNDYKKEFYPHLLAIEKILKDKNALIKLDTGITEEELFLEDNPELIQDAIEILEKKKSDPAYNVQGDELTTLKEAFVQLFTHIKMIELSTATKTAGRLVSKLSTKLKFDSFKNMPSISDVIQRYVEIAEMFNAQEDVKEKFYTPKKDGTQRSVNKKSFPVVTNIIPDTNMSVDEFKRRVKEGEKFSYPQATFTMSFRFIIEQLGKFFPEISINNIQRIFDHFPNPNPESVRKITSDMHTYYLSGFGNFANMSQDMLYNLPQTIKGLMRGIPEGMQSNRFLANLKITTNSFGLVEIQGRTKSADMQELIREDFDKLAHAIPSMARMLVMYAYSKDHLKFSPNGIAHLMLPSTINKLFPELGSYEAKYAERVTSENFNMDNFLVQYITNNPKDPMYSKDISFAQLVDLAGKKDEEGNLVDIRDSFFLGYQRLRNQLEVEKFPEVIYHEGKEREYMYYHKGDGYYKLGKNFSLDGITVYNMNGNISDVELVVTPANSSGSNIDIEAVTKLAGSLDSGELSISKINSEQAEKDNNLCGKS